MSNNRDKQTNALLGTICSIVDETEELEFPVTLTVAGQLITGIIISEKKYYDLPENELLKGIYAPIKEDKLKYFDEANNLKNPDATDEEISAIPDDIWQRFIYLKNARYISGNIFIPSELYKGVAIQVRASDVSAFSAGALSATNSENNA